MDYHAAVYEFQEPMGREGDNRLSTRAGQNRYDPTISPNPVGSPPTPPPGPVPQQGYGNSTGAYSQYQSPQGSSSPPQQYQFSVQPIDNGYTQQTQYQPANIHQQSYFTSQPYQQQAPSYGTVVAGGNPPGPGYLQQSHTMPLPQESPVIQQQYGQTMPWSQGSSAGQQQYGQPGSNAAYSPPALPNRAETYPLTYSYTNQNPQCPTCSSVMTVEAYRTYCQQCGT